MVLIRGNYDDRKSLNKFQTATLLSDMETTALPRQDITLRMLTGQNREKDNFYNPRDKFVNRLTNYKRMSIHNYARELAVYSIPMGPASIRELNAMPEEQKGQVDSGTVKEHGDVVTTATSTTTSSSSPSSSASSNSPSCPSSASSSTASSRFLNDLASSTSTSNSSRTASARSANLNESACLNQELENLSQNFARVMTFKDECSAKSIPYCNASHNSASSTDHSIMSSPSGLVEVMSAVSSASSSSIGDWQQTTSTGGSASSGGHHQHPPRPRNDGTSAAKPAVFYYDPNFPHVTKEGWKIVFHEGAEFGNFLYPTYYLTKTSNPLEQEHIRAETPRPGTYAKEFDGRSLLIIERQLDTFQQNQAQFAPPMFKTLLLSLETAHADALRRNPDLVTKYTLIVFPKEVDSTRLPGSSEDNQVELKPHCTIVFDENAEEVVGTTVGFMIATKHGGCQIMKTTPMRKSMQQLANEARQKAGGSPNPHNHHTNQYYSNHLAPPSNINTHHQAYTAGQRYAYSTQPEDPSVHSSATGHSSMNSPLRYDQRRMAAYTNQHPSAGAEYHQSMTGESGCPSAAWSHLEATTAGLKNEVGSPDHAESDAGSDPSKKRPPAPNADRSSIESPKKKVGSLFSW